jgi:hypothetical protein
MPKHKPDPMPAFTEPLKVSVVDGEVVISGPEWLHASLEPCAAQASADRLTVAADQAKSDRVAAAPGKVPGKRVKAEKPRRNQ